MKRNLMSKHPRNNKFTTKSLKKKKLSMRNLHTKKVSIIKCQQNITKKYPQSSMLSIKKCPMRSINKPRNIRRQKNTKKQMSIKKLYTNQSINNIRRLRNIKRLLSTRRAIMNQLNKLNIMKQSQLTIKKKPPIINQSQFIIKIIMKLQSMQNLLRKSTSRLLHKRSKKNTSPINRQRVMSQVIQLQQSRLSLKCMMPHMLHQSDDLTFIQQLISNIINIIIKQSRLPKLVYSLSRLLAEIHKERVESFLYQFG